MSRWAQVEKDSLGTKITRVLRYPHNFPFNFGRVIAVYEVHQKAPLKKGERAPMPQVKIRVEPGHEERFKEFKAALSKPYGYVHQLAGKIEVEQGAKPIVEFLPKG